MASTAAIIIECCGWRLLRCASACDMVKFIHEFFWFVLGAVVTLWLLRAEWERTFVWFCSCRLLAVFLGLLVPTWAFLEFVAWAGLPVSCSTRSLTWLAETAFAWLS